MHIKVCGITRPEDAIAAQALGVQALGLVFYAKSKRFVSLDTAKAIVEHVYPFTHIVALFVDATREQVTEVLETIPVNVLQFHGGETEDFCTQFDRPYIKALPVESCTQLEEAAKRYASARAYLLDSVHDGAFGGTGKVFDWQLVPAALRSRCILAGGLTADNVAQGIRVVRPVAVDVSSGVESAPGQKDLHKLQQFVNAVRTATRGETP